MWLVILFCIILALLIYYFLKNKCLSYIKTAKAWKGKCQQIGQVLMCKKSD